MAGPLPFTLRNAIRSHHWNRLLTYVSATILVFVKSCLITISAIDSSTYNTLFDFVGQPRVAAHFSYLPEKLGFFTWFP
jgi:succinate dehydrogenase hydrophobic anchor subunit